MQVEKYKPWIVVIIGSLYFFFDSILIVFPSAMTTGLMHKYIVGATGLSFLAAIYFYVYAPLQISNGFLLNRFGPKKIMLVGMFIANTGLLLFALSNHYIIGCTARALMAIGASAGYVVPLLLARSWLDKKYYVLAVGGIVFIECLGAILAQVIITSLIGTFAINEIVVGILLLGILLTALFYLFVSDAPKNITITKTKLSIKNLVELLSNKKNWFLAVSAALFWAPTAIFASLWGIDYLHLSINISKTLASKYMILVWVGVGLGGPVIGYIVKYFDKKLLFLIFFSFVGLVNSLYLLYIHKGPHLATILSLLILGISCSAQALTFGIVNDTIPKNKLGLAFGFNNMVICFGNAIFQMLGGHIIDCLWDHKIVNGIKVYSLTSYQVMLSLMPISYLILVGLSVALIFKALKNRSTSGYFSRADTIHEIAE